MLVPGFLMRRTHRHTIHQTQHLWNAVAPDKPLQSSLQSFDVRSRLIHGHFKIVPTMAYKRAVVVFVSAFIQPGREDLTIISITSVCILLTQLSISFEIENKCKLAADCSGCLFANSTKCLCDPLWVALKSASSLSSHGEGS